MGNSKNTADKKRGGISVTDMIPPDVPESTREDLIAFLSAAEQELEDVFTGGPLMQPSIILALRHARDVYFNELNVRKKHILLHSTINISTHMAATKLAMMRLADVAREDKNRARTAQAAEVQEVRDIAHEETEPEAAAMDQGSSSQEEETQDASDTRTMVVSGDMSALTVDSACAEIVDDLQDASSEGFLTQPTQEVGAGGSEAESASDVQQAREEGTAPSDSIVKSSEENDTRRPFTAYTPHPPEYDELLLRLEEPIAMQQLSVYYDTIASLLVEARAEIFDAKDIMWGIGAATQNSFRRTQKLLEENEVARAEIAHWNSKLDELDEEIDSNYPELSDVVQRAQ